MDRAYINVIGAGLAGCEAAWQAAIRGVKVRLYEMKPAQYTPAHSSDQFAELVCSNSFRAAGLENAIGLLKKELRLLGSLVMEAALNTKVEAGGALAVDRAGFSEYITKKIISHENIEVIHDEVTAQPDDAITIYATGPLTSDKLSEYLRTMMPSNYLYFFDAAAPIVDRSSIDMSRAFYASRYDKGEASYINCPMSRDEYTNFYNELIVGKTAHLHDADGDGLTVFEGCMPVEVMASRGFETLLYGPLKPVGLVDPRTGEQPFAVVQLRIDDAKASLYNIVGFQTHLTFGEQKRIFGLIPGLEKASFVRYGVMHRNTYINSPAMLSDIYNMRENPDVFFAGQMTGVEGYMESASSGFVAGINAAKMQLGQSTVSFSPMTAIGALAAYISDERITRFQPMNVNFGIVPTLGSKIKGGKKVKNLALSQRSLDIITQMLANKNI